jgi:putative acetyltransferase
MNPLELEFRTATPADAEGISRVLEAFTQLEPGSVAWQARIAYVRGTAPVWRVGVLGGEIVSAVAASADAVWFGTSCLKWSDVGEVSVLPTLQGQGIGTLAMRDVVRHLSDSGVAVSRLGGLLRFYSRFGYEPFPRCYVEFPLCDPVRAGAKRIPLTEVLDAPDADGQVRAFDLKLDWPRVSQVVDDATRHRTGCRVWRHPATPPERLQRAVVYESGGTAHGMASFTVTETDATPFEASVMIYQLNYERGCPAALEGLVKHVSRVAYQRGARRVTAYLPGTDEIYSHLQRTGLDFSRCEFMGGVAGNMVRVVNLRAMLEQMLPELQIRLRETVFQEALTIDLGDQQAGLHVIGERIEVAEPAPGSFQLRLSHAAWLRAVLGVSPPCWSKFAPPGSPAWLLLNTLLPPVRGSYTT